MGERCCAFSLPLPAADCSDRTCHQHCYAASRRQRRRSPRLSIACTAVSGRPVGSCGSRDCPNDGRVNRRPWTAFCEMTAICYHDCAYSVPRGRSEHTIFCTRGCARDDVYDCTFVLHCLPGKLYAICKTHARFHWPPAGSMRGVPTMRGLCCAQHRI